MKVLSFEELRVLYRKFLNSLDYKQTTIDTSYSDSFYLWKKESKDLFWNVVTSPDFESVAKVDQCQIFRHKESFKELKKNF